MNDRITARIDPSLKQEVNGILSQIGLSEAEAIRLFYAQIRNHDGLPFALRKTAKNDDDETLDFIEQTADFDEWTY